MSEHSGYRVAAVTHVGYAAERTSYSFHMNLNDALAEYDAEVAAGHAKVFVTDLGVPYRQPAQIVRAHYADMETTR